MPFLYRTPITVHKFIFMFCWATVAYCRIAGHDTRVLTAGPVFAPVPAVRRLEQRAAVLQ
jgi:hypothetical protein